MLVLPSNSNYIKNIKILRKALKKVNRDIIEKMLSSSSKASIENGTNIYLISDLNFSAKKVFSARLKLVMIT